MTNALIDILRRGGFWWSRPPQAPGRGLAIPNTTRFRVALGAPAGGPFAGGTCRDGRLMLDSGGRVFESAPAMCAAVRDTPDDPFACIEFSVGGQWLSADAIRRSGALPWDEADEVALEIAIDAVREKLRSGGETLSGPEIVRKAAEVMAVTPYFRDEAMQRLDWLRK